MIPRDNDTPSDLHLFIKDLTLLLNSGWQFAFKRIARALKGRARAVLAFVLAGSLCLGATPSAHGPSASALDLNPKLYASSLITNKSQFKCLIKLYNQESNWNYKAHNGTHYGIPQGNSIALKRMNPIQQINWGIKYINHRYQGDTCKAYQHLLRYNWH